jgi:hypothetical protein
VRAQGVDRVQTLSERCHPGRGAGRLVLALERVPLEVYSLRSDSVSLPVSGVWQLTCL